MGGAVGELELFEQLIGASFALTGALAEVSARSVACWI